MDFHLPYDKIDVASYKTYKGTAAANSKKAIAEAQKRIKTNTHYINVQKRAKDLKKIREQYTYSLNLEAFSKQQEALKAEEKMYSDSAYKPVFGAIQPLKSDLDEVGNDDTRKAQRTDWIKPYNKDAGLEQAVLIARDVAGK
jgi:hypothetical protein